MSYLGGKAKCSQFIIDILNNEMFDNMNYIEPFIGYAHILRRVENKKSYIASDNNRLLIELLKGIQNNKKIPIISRSKYYILKYQTIITFERAIACFCYSYNGKEWGGYAPKDKSGLHNYVKQRTNYYKKLQNNSIFLKTKITCKDYTKLKPKNSLIYCDPPYEGTASYGSNDFDNDKFWNYMRNWSKNNFVFISEYKAPSDFVCVGSCVKRSTIAGNGSKDERIEKLFIHKSLLKS
jgi:DNA adenine methylase